MTTRYAIMYIGTEYNDEGYNVGGDNAMILPKTFATKEKATVAALNELENILSGFNLRDFDNSYGSPSYSREFCLARHGDEWYWGAKWEEYIEWCEEMGYDWTSGTPNLLQISEIEID